MQTETSTLGVTSLDLKIGDYKLYSIPTGQFRLDGGAMFGTVPKVLWERTNPSDEQNRILMESRALLLKSNDKVILIDNGNGADFKLKYGEKAGAKFEEIYGVDNSGVNLISSLKKIGLKTSDITDVILTHLHFDHAGGSTCERNGELKPTFKNATYYVQKENLLTAQNPNKREKASYLKPNFEPLIKAECLKTLDGPQELFPGVFVSLSHGHTHAQQNVLITGGELSLFYCADLIPTSTHTRLAWVMGYDLNPLQIINEKEKILSEASKNNWYLFFEHDPYCDAAQVKKGERDFEITKKFNLI